MLGIILSRRDCSEFDQVISVYTKEHGKYGFLLRGVKKMAAKNAAHLEPGTFIEFESVSGKGLPIGTSVEPQFLPEAWYRSLEGALYGSFGIRLLERLVESGESDPKLFNLFANWLITLAKKPFCAQVLTVRFIAQLLIVLGFEPVLDACVACEQTLSGAFILSFGHGGLLCNNCARALPPNAATTTALSAEAAVIFKKMFARSASLPEMPRQSWQAGLPAKVRAPFLAAEQAIHRYLVYQTGRSLPFWGQLAKLSAV